MNTIIYGAHELPENSSIYIYGCGYRGSKFYCDVTKMRPDVTVLGFLDTHHEGVFLELKKIRYDNLECAPTDIIVVCSNYANEIIQSIFRHESQFVVYHEKELMETTKLHYNMRVATLSDFPSNISIETVYGCNLKCQMCPLQGEKNNSRRATSMTTETFDLIVDEISDVKRKVRLNIIGEPLLNGNICDFVAKLKGKGHRVSLATNGTRLDEHMAKEFSKSGIDEVNISVDAYSKDKYEKIRIGASRDSVIGNIIYFAGVNKEYNPNGMIRIDPIVCDFTFDDMPELSNFCEQYNLAINPIPLGRWGDWEIPEYFGANRYHDWVKEVPGHETLVPRKVSPRRHPCIQIWDSMFISAEGNPILCCYDYKLESKMPNVHDKNLARIWSEDIGRIRQQQVSGIFSGRCAKCCSLGPEYFY